MIDRSVNHAGAARLCVREPLQRGLQSLQGFLQCLVCGLFAVSGLFEFIDLLEQSIEGLTHDSGSMLKGLPLL
jgi:hypothetical protein